MNLKSIFSKKDSLEISQDQKQQILLTVFIIIILITIILLYFGFWRSSMATNIVNCFYYNNFNYYYSFIFWFLAIFYVSNKHRRTI